MKAVLVWQVPHFLVRTQFTATSSRNSRVFSSEQVFASGSSGLFGPALVRFTKAESNGRGLAGCRCCA
jgi:hypothetical protein